LGPRLDGSPGVATVPDTDHGLLDGDTVWDRAVGPMQFLPATWRQWGTDGNGDGVADPNNIYDATVTAGRYLCAAGADLSDPTQLRAAVYRYNQSWAYVDLVLQWAQAYQTGVVPTPPAPGPVPPGTTGNGGRMVVTAPAPPIAATLPPATPSGPPTTLPAPTPSSPPTATTTTAPTPTPTASTPSPSPPSPATTTTAPTPTTTPASVPSPSPPSPPTTTTAPMTTAPVTSPAAPTLGPRPPVTTTIPTTSSPLSPSPRPADAPPLG
ncbi:MAG: lytic transglycosylase domain-containing protein, partial [Pseudonocardiales bacterium]|nr:lytic transglycosylase domain-containing protein [Pseudonocardiales bacterium]